MIAMKVKVIAVKVKVIANEPLIANKSIILRVRKDHVRISLEVK